MGEYKYEDWKRPSRLRVYHKSEPAAYLDEITPGTRVALAPRQRFGEIAETRAMVLASGIGAPGAFSLKLESGPIVPANLGARPFRVLHNEPKILPLDAVVGSCEAKARFTYGLPQLTDDHTQNYFREGESIGEEKARKAAAIKAADDSRVWRAGRRAAASAKKDAEEARAAAADLAAGKAKLEAARDAAAESAADDAAHLAKEKLALEAKLARQAAIIRASSGG